MNFKITRKPYTIVIWDCGHPNHHHRTEKVAVNCLAQRNAPRKRPDLTARNHSIVEDWLQHQNATAIAKKYKRSVQTILDILQEYFKHAYRLKHRKNYVQFKWANRARIIMNDEMHREILKTKAYQRHAIDLERWEIPYP